MRSPSIPGIDTVDDLRMRWAGHRLIVEATVTSDPAMPVGEFHELEHHAADLLRDRLPRLDTVRLSPAAHPHDRETPPTTRPGDPRLVRLFVREAVKAWFLISLQTFGGPAGQIAVMQRTLVDEKRWIGQRRFLHALNYLHAAARPRGPATRHLHRLAAQRPPRRTGRRQPVRAARHARHCSACRLSTSPDGDTP